MKKIYFLTLAAVFFTSANAQIIQDDFEDYPLGSYFGGHWSNWSQSSSATTEDIIISDDVASSGTQSGHIGDSGVQDALLVFDQVFSGVYSFQFEMYIPVGRTGYYNFQNTLANLGVEGNWGNQVYFGLTPDTVPLPTPGTGYITGTEFYYPFTYPEDTWFTVTTVIDLNEATTRMYIDGEEVITADGSPIPYPGDNFSIEAMDFYSHTTSNFYYIDDLTMVEGDITMATNDINNASSISVYPTVATEAFNVTSKNIITEVSIFNTAGQQVMRISPKSSTANINVNTLQPGVYIVKTMAGKEVKTTKVIVK
jgi:hypothetical protein